MKTSSKKSVSVSDKKVLKDSFGSIGKVRSYILENANDLTNKSVCRVLRESKKDKQIYEILNSYAYKNRQGLTNMGLLYDLCAAIGEISPKGLSNDELIKSYTIEALAQYKKVVNGKLTEINHKILKLTEIKAIAPAEQLAKVEKSILTANEEKARLESLIK